MDFEFPESLDSIDNVPGQFRPLYAEVDGKFTLGESYKGVATAVTGLNKSLKASRAETKAAKGSRVDLSPLAGFGDTPETIAETVTAQLAELNEKISKGDKIDPEKIKADLAKGFAKEREGLTTRNEALTGQLYNLMVENAATSAISESKGIPELLMPFVTSQVKVGEENGKFSVNVVDGEGDLRYSGVTGAPMAISELVGEMKGQDKFARLFESDTQEGGGGTKPGAVSRGKSVSTKDMTANQRIAAGLNKRSR